MESTEQHSPSEQPAHSSPLATINLPKGGGAIRDIGENFSVNSVTGTGSTNVPIHISPSRSGFGPALSLSYDSGSGNGPFGFGWQLEVPSITRKTDKGLPLYQDEEESDTFLLAGAEDLVPVLAFEGGDWSRQNDQRYEGNHMYNVRQYRPRVEEAFIRIERWTQLQSGDIHWRTISSDNTTIIYGETANSRVFDPSSNSDTPRVFTWLLSRSFDDKGNIFIYEYKAENSERIDTGAANERNRTELSRSSQRYLKRIKYGNRISHLTEPGCDDRDWMFEVVLDYGEHQESSPSTQEVRPWDIRPDPFSSYRSGFEVRTYRLCKRILMFHQFPGEVGVGNDCLVTSFEIVYHQTNEQSFNVGNRIASFVSSVTQCAYQRQEDGYIQKALPPMEFEYSQSVVSDIVQELGQTAMENLPAGLDDSLYCWLDLDGEGISGTLTRQGGSYFYKSNLGDGKLGAMESLTISPSTIGDIRSQDHWMDLAGDGHMDLVQLGGRTPGFYRRLWTPEGGWEEFKPFKCFPNSLPVSANAQYLDLTGDGLADILIANDEVFTWYPSLGEVGFDSAEYSRAPLDEEDGPRLIVSDISEALYTADMSGDGLADLVRIRNREICYWPNLGYGAFGKKVIMDNSPRFDFPETFQQSRIRLFDIDGSGTTDLIYLSGDGVFYYQNESGNSWTEGHYVKSFPRLDNMSQVQVVDLLGHGTGCLVWSSKLPSDSGRQIRYVDLMGSQKPHLLISQRNNLGSETHIHYVSSTKFYLQDKARGHPWATRLPFPVHVVDRTEVFDYISRNRFVSRYTYHDGFFDGVEREFHGFGMVEQLDTEEFASLRRSDLFPNASNIDAASHVPPVLTRTWYHTGAYFEGAQISRYHELEYFREPGLTDDEYKAMLLDDTILPQSVRSRGSRIQHELTPGENREACRALRGRQLRQEIYALDGSEAEHRPYQVAEANFTIDIFQPRSENRHACLFTHPRESIQFNYERKLYPIKGRQLADPRITHSLTLATDEFGNVVEGVSIAYGRRHDDPSRILKSGDRKMQKCAKITYISNKYTNHIASLNSHRNPLPAESRTYELFNVPSYFESDYFTSLYRIQDLRGIVQRVGDGCHDLCYDNLEGKGAVQHHPYRRLIDHRRVIYRKDNLSGPLPLGQVESLAVPFDSYQKALTVDYAEAIFLGSGRFSNREALAAALQRLGYVQTEGDSNWWIPSGKTFFSPNSNDTPAEELEYARQHYFQALRFRDAFYSDTNRSEWSVSYDTYDLLMQETRDALGNRVTVGERNINPDLPPVVSGHDYRLLAPNLVTDVNRNRAAIARDVLGYVVGSAVMGKPGEGKGDTLDGFDANLPESVIEAHFNDPFESAVDLLGGATSRFIYDVYAFQRDKDRHHPTGMSTITRTTHQGDLGHRKSTDIMLNMSYFDGFGRAIQTKIQAGEGLLHRNDLEEGNDGVPRRFICSGWTIFNNKGNAVRKYEPFFTPKHTFEFDVRVGVTATLFYDPAQRLIATLFPDQTWSKSVFDAWGEQKWDANDTALRNPIEDQDVGDYFRRLLSEDEAFVTWYERRIGGDLGRQEKDAAAKAAAHADTPTDVFLDTLGRKFLTVERNKNGFGCEASDEYIRDFTLYDVQGHKRSITDANGRKVCLYDYDMTGTKVRQSSMEAGQLWILHDVSGNQGYGWDSRRQRFRTAYDVLHRAIEVYLSVPGGEEALVEKTIYGETLEEPERLNTRQQAVEIFDQSGKAFSDEFDFKGNLLKSSRQLAKEYKSDIDWQQDVDMEPEILSNLMTYDAVNRKVRVTAPDGSVTNYYYNDVGLVQSIGARLYGSIDEQSIVKNVEYNARSQRLSTEHGNGTRTVNEYDDLTFHLRSVITHHNKPPSAGSEPGRENVKDIQSLHYTYDPIGNVVHIRDSAQQRIFFRNKCVDPTNDFTYDALYRLTESTGREHLAQVTDPSGKGSQSHAEHSNDRKVMARYSERYIYDLTGNVLEIRHQSADSSHGSWTKRFEYKEPSQIEPGKMSNRLSKMTVGNKTEHFSYGGDAGLLGNITSMSTLPIMGSNYKNELSMSARQAVYQGSTPETTYYRYDARGQRVRKITERYTKCGETPTVLKERIYIGSFERFRKFSSNKSITLERETLCFGDEETNFVLAETRTVGEDKGLKETIRYQYGNHINSVSIELGRDAELISYEEYSAFGDTTYQASYHLVEAPKRYRFSGKELDSENGLYYYGARYYLPHICRWISCDPGGLKDGPNLYLFVKCNPVSKTDPNGRDTTWWNRAAGALGLIGGAVEVALGAAGIAAPTGVTQVVGAAAIAHGADTTWAGLKQVWTGEEQKTYARQGVTKAAEALGASRGTAEKIGAATDFITLGGKLLQKTGGALKKTGAGAGDAAGGAGNAVVEAARDFASTGRSLLRNRTGIVDDLAARLPGNTHHESSGSQTSAFDNMLMMTQNLGERSSENSQRGESSAATIGEEMLNAAVDKMLKIKEYDPEYLANNDHHLFPRQHEKFFKTVDIEIDKFTIPIPKVAHQILHGHWKEHTGLTDWNWNIEWRDWILLNPKATRQMTFEKLQVMMDKYGIASHWNKWRPYRS